MSTHDQRERIQNDLRHAVYRAIRDAIARSPARQHRGIVIHVLCAMAAEQAAIVAQDATSAAAPYDASGNALRPQRLSGHSGRRKRETL